VPVFLKHSVYYLELFLYRHIDIECYLFCLTNIQCIFPAQILRTFSVFSNSSNVFEVLYKKLYFKHFSFFVFIVVTLLSILVLLRHLRYWGLF